MTEKKLEKNILSSECINKTGKTGQVYGSILVEVIEYNGSKVIQLTQHKHKRVGVDIVIKQSIITLDPKNEDLKKAIMQAYKI